MLDANTMEEALLTSAVAVAVAVAHAQSDTSTSAPLASSSWPGKQGWAAVTEARQEPGPSGRRAPAAAAP